MNVNSYIYGDSFYHRYDIRPKLFVTLFYSIIVFFISSWPGFVLIFIIPLVLMGIAVGGRETWHCYSRLIPLFLILILFMPFQARSGAPVLSFRDVVVVTEEGCWIIMRIIARLGGISGVLMLLLLTERSEDIIKGLRAFHMPYNAALTASMILRFIPYLGCLFTEIRDSMSLRLEAGKRGYPILPSITALAVAAIRMIPDTAAVLEERGFGRLDSAKTISLPRPAGYLTQWLLSVIIPCGLLLFR